MRHVLIEPAIHYWGTPVVLVSTVDHRSTVNVAPMSSVFWLGWSAMLGLRTSENLLATREDPDSPIQFARLAGVRRRGEGWCVARPVP